MFGRISNSIRLRLQAALSQPRHSFTMATSDWKTVTNGDSSYDVFTKPIQKPQLDDRDYRLIKLDNGLTAIVIHDPNADKAAACLDVAIGHLHDPDDMPGMAHFCEHLLFMGTESFPRENEYSEFLSKNNGASNAFTSTCNTNYYFNVSTHALVPALERFAAFFHCPLFSPSCTSRELNAVDSENKKNLQNDMWRIFQLNKHLSIDGHPWRKFGTGHRDSLSKAARELKAKGKLGQNGTYSEDSSLYTTPATSRSQSPVPSSQSNKSEEESDGGSVGRETRRRLVEWWSKEYCASRMRLCVLGKEPLDELSNIVWKLFSPIRNRGQEPLPMFPVHPFGPNEMGTLVSVKTVMAFHCVEVSFPLTFQQPLWRYKPANLIAHFLGHEGPGSLHSYLKQKGWCITLEADSQELARGFEMLKATIRLTEQGFQNYRAVILSVLKYLSLLRSSDFPPWYQKERVTILGTHFRFQEKRHPDDYVSKIAQIMSWPVPPELAIAGPQLVWEWDTDGEGERQVREVLDTLRITRGRVVLMGPGDSHNKLAEGEWLKEPWYGTEYRVVRFDGEFMKEAEGSNDIKELFLPGPNKFIPTNLEVAKQEAKEPSKRPHLIRETPLSSLWHKKDDQFQVPKAHVIADIRSPIPSFSPRASVLTRIYTSLVNDALTEFSYDADLAGLKYGFGSHPLGITLSLSGYNDKLYTLAQSILQKAKDLVVHEDRLAIIKDKLRREYINFFFNQTYRIADYYSEYLLAADQWPMEEKLKEIMSVTREEVQGHISQLLKEVHIRMVVSGNMYKDEAMNLADMIENILSPSPVSPLSVVSRALLPPKGSNFVWSMPVPNKNESNSALLYFLYIGSRTDRKMRVLVTLLAQMLTEPAHNVLRTKEQLGYVVLCSQVTLHGAGHVGIRIIVQSERGPAYLEERVEEFLDTMLGVITDMDEEVFGEYKVGLEKRWREKHKNLSEEMSSFWAQVDSGYLDFYRSQEDADYLANVTKQDILDLYNHRIHPAAPDRAKISVHLHSQKPRPKQISEAAAQAFEEKVIASGITPAGSIADELGNSQMSVVDFVEHWKNVLGDDPQAKDLLADIPALVDKYPATDQDLGRRLAGPIYIEDVAQLRKSLSLSEDPKPVVEWGDLPVSKF